MSATLLTHDMKASSSLGPQTSITGFILMRKFVSEYAWAYGQVRLRKEPWDQGSSPAWDLGTLMGPGQMPCASRSKVYMDYA